MDRNHELERHLTWLDDALQAAEPNAVAGLVRERRITVNELASSGTIGSVRNDLADARQKRRAAAAVAAQAAAKRGVKRGS